MPNKIQGWIAWLITTLFVVYSFCLATAAATFSDAIKTSLKASNVGISLASGAFILGFACMQIPAGYLLDKYNTRYVVSAGVLLLALGNLLISFSNTLLLFAGANLLQGIGGAFAFIAAGVVISQWFAAKKFPILFGLTQTFSCGMAALLHYFFTLALANHSWNMLYRGLALFGAILFILSLLWVKNPSANKNVKTISLKKSLAAVTKNTQIWLCAIAAATSFGIVLAYGSFWFVQIQKYYAVANLEAVIIGGMVFFGLSIGTPLFGWLSNKIKSRIVVIHTTLIFGTMALLLGIYLPHFNIKTLIIIKIVSFFIGFFLSGAMLFYTVVSEISSNTTRGLALSVTNTVVFLFNALMMFMPYLFITTLSKEFFTYLWLLPFCTLFSIFLVYFIKDTYQK